MKFYVYVYLDPRKPGRFSYNNISFLWEPFYVGKGNGNRYLDHLKCLEKHYNLYFKNKLNKIIRNGFSKSDIEKKIIILSNLNEEESFIIEKDLIKQIGRSCNKKGNLVNLTDGGDGISGYVHSSKAKKKMSKEHKGEKNYMFGKHHSKETKKKIGQALKGRKSPMLGRHQSEEARKKIGQAHKGENHYMFGKHYSEEVKKKRSLVYRIENHPMFGKHHSEETKKKIGQAQMNEKNHMFGKHPSEETKKKRSLALRIRNQLERENGEKHYNAKLTKGQVHQIHMLYRLNFLVKEISQEYNVNSATIYNILSGNSWEYVYEIFKKYSSKEHKKRLSEKQVHQIHMLYRLHFSSKEISQKYKVLPITIYNIISGTTWLSIYKLVNNIGVRNGC